MPEANIRVAGDEVLGLEASRRRATRRTTSATSRDGTLLAGDAAASASSRRSYVLPASPPPDIDVEAWHGTIDEIERRAPERLALIHFGVADDVPDHLAACGSGSGCGASVRGSAMSEETFAVARADLEADGGARDAGQYLHGGPPTQSYAGLSRYWAKKRGAPKWPATGGPKNRGLPADNRCAGRPNTPRCRTERKPLCLSASRTMSRRSTPTAI